MSAVLSPQAPTQTDVGARLAVHARTLVPAWREITAGRPA